MYLFGIDTSLCLLLAVVVFGYALQCYLHFLLPKIRYNSLKMMKDIVNEYFFQEEILHITSNNEEYSAQCDIKYSLITKIYETKRYFIIYHNHTQAYIVDKSTFEDGATEDIRQILPAKINGKFVKCNW